MSSAVRESQATVRAEAIKTAAAVSADTEAAPQVIVNPIAQETETPEAPALMLLELGILLIS